MLLKHEEHLPLNEHMGNVGYVIQSGTLVNLTNDTDALHIIPNPTDLTDFKSFLDFSTYFDVLYQK